VIVIVELEKLVGSFIKNFEEFWLKGIVEWSGFVELNFVCVEDMRMCVWFIFGFGEVLLCWIVKYIW